MKIYRMSEIEYMLDAHDHIRGGETAAILARNKDDAWAAFFEMQHLLIQRRIRVSRIGRNKNVCPFWMDGLFPQELDHDLAIKLRFYSSYSLKTIGVRAEHIVIPDDIFDDVMYRITGSHNEVVITSSDWPAIEVWWFNEQFVRPCINIAKQKRRAIVKKSTDAIDAFFAEFGGGDTND